MKFSDVMKHWVNTFGSLKFRAGTAQKMKFFIKDFFSKCDQIRSVLRIWSHLLKKSLMENFIFCIERAEVYGLHALSSLFAMGNPQHSILLSGSYRLCC